MNQDKTSKKLPYKKSIVRNTVQIKPQTVVLMHSEVSKPSSKKISAPNVAINVDTTSFEAPELNSALKIVKRIESVESVKPKKVKSVLDIGKNKQTVVEEKASKLVNFPYNKNIYKDLMPLCVRPQPAQVVPNSSREFVLQKDREPSLSDFFEPKRLPEYKFQVSTQPSQKNLVRQFDGLKLYRTMRSWN